MASPWVYDVLWVVAGALLVSSVFGITYVNRLPAVRALKNHIKDFERYRETHGREHTDLTLHIGQLEGHCGRIMSEIDYWREHARGYEQTLALLKAEITSLRDQAYRKPR